MKQLDRLHQLAIRITQRIALLGFTVLVLIALLTFYDGAARYLDLPRVTGFSDFGKLLFPMVIASCFPALRATARFWLGSRPSCQFRSRLSRPVSSPSPFPCFPSVSSRAVVRPASPCPAPSSSRPGPGAIPAAGPGREGWGELRRCAPPLPWCACTPLCLRIPRVPV